MTTIESWNDLDIEVTWSFKEISEVLDGGWCEWFMDGYDAYGNEYYGVCQADKNNPEDSHDEIKEVEHV